MMSYFIFFVMFSSLVDFSVIFFLSLLSANRVMVHVMIRSS